MSDPRPCLACGHNFTPEHGNTMTCSPKCKKTRERQVSIGRFKGADYADSVLDRLEYTDTARSGREFPDEDVPTIDGDWA